MADAADDQRGVAVYDCTETSTVAIRKVSVGTLTVAICDKHLTSAWKSGRDTALVFRDVTVRFDLLGAVIVI